MEPTIFDIETEALQPEALAQYIKPFRQIMPFDPASVKTGDIDKQVKKFTEEERTKMKADKIEAARLAHEKEYSDDKWNYEKECQEKAALSPVTGTVLVIGYHTPHDGRFAAIAADAEGFDEASVIDSFWTFACQAIEEGGLIIGVNILEFDLPFLVRRSWILGLSVPKVIRKGRYWADNFVDLCDVWRCGQRMGGESASFDYMAKALGLGGKPAGISGADFARLWREDRKTAVGYLKNDLAQPARMAQRMGILETYTNEKVVT